MKEKPIKQPWPRSAKITVWVLGVVLALSFVWHMSFRVAAYDHIQNLEYKIILGESDKDYLRAKLRGEPVMDEISPDVVMFMHYEAEGKARGFCFPWCPNVFFMSHPIPIELPIEEPKEEDTPIIMPDLDDPMIEYSGTDSH